MKVQMKHKDKNLFKLQRENKTVDNFLTDRTPFSPCPFIEETDNQKLRLNISAGSLNDLNNEL